MSQIKYILLIEDEDIGQTYVDLLQKHNSFWRVTWVRTISEVKSYESLDRLHVFIFDQRLGPNELGTDAFKYVHENNPRVQGIMLSGVALAKDYDKAQSISNNRVQYVNKEDVLKLPQEVSVAIERYYALLPRIDDNIRLKKGIPFKLFSKKPIITLLSHYVIEEDYVFENKWKIDVKIRSGENVKLTKTKKRYAKTAIVHELEASLAHDIGISNSIVHKALEKQFSLKRTGSMEIGTEIINQDERTYTLPSEQSSTVQVNYEYNEIYTKIRAHVSIQCPMCRGTQYLDYDVYIPQNRILERRVAFNSLLPTQITELSKTTR